jgi:hypothetical protein
MNKGHIYSGLAAFIAAATITTALSGPVGASGGGSGGKPVPAATGPAPVAKGGGGGGGGIASSVLPRDFPTALVPLPAGNIVASAGKSPNWSVLIVIPAGAAQGQKAAIAFFVANGFTADSAFVVHNSLFRLTMLAVNRDHSATKSNLTIAIARI